MDERREPWDATEDLGPYEFRRGYVVASIQRSGSTLLATALRQTRELGVTHEYFSYEAMSHFDERWGVLRPRHLRRWDDGIRRRVPGMQVRSMPWTTRSLRHYLALVRRHRCTANGVFGMKLHSNHLANLASHGLDVDRWLHQPDYVRITRQDRLGQAVSWLRADQTGRYVGTMEARAEPVYDRAGIDDRLAQIEESERLWDRHLIGRPVHRVVYEELVTDWSAVMTGVMASLGCEAPVPAMALERQADDLSTEWIERYRSGR